MDLGPLRTLALALNFNAHGVPATVTRPPPDGAPVVTSGIWLSRPVEEQLPVGTDFQRREPRRVMVLPRDVLSRVPRGSLITAPEQLGGVVKTWRVDEFDRTEADQWRVVVVPSS